jgi:adenylyltransferase/sulfurtransferase
MSAHPFSKKELERYSRHLIIPEFNIKGQTALRKAKVLVVGTGGLGAPLLQYLTAAGVGTIGILDFDVVEDHNLQRQVLFSTDDIGKPKVQAAKERLEKLNPYIDFKVHNTYLNSENALDIIQEYDIVADGTDNFPTRYLINDTCVLLDKINVYASIYRFDGQVTVFNYQNEDGTRGPNYRDLFPTPPPPGLVPSCSEGGVIGVLPGILGSLQANEVIKVASGVGEPLSGRMLLMDASGMEVQFINLLKRKDNPLSGENPTQTELIDYEQFCGIPAIKKEGASEGVKEIDVATLYQWQTEGRPFQLIDVREPYEWSIADLEGEKIIKGQHLERMEEVRKDVPVVVHCRSGKRSADVIRDWEKEGSFDNLYNLKGGILAWAKEIDQELAIY